MLFSVDGGNGDSEFDYTTQEAPSTPVTCTPTCINSCSSAGQSYLVLGRFYEKPEDHSNDEELRILFKHSNSLNGKFKYFPSLLNLLNFNFRN